MTRHRRATRPAPGAKGARLNRDGIRPVSRGRPPGLATGVAAAVLAFLMSPLVAAPGAAASPGPCADTNGVTVVVDFGAFGAGVEVGCAPGEPASGQAALQAAGFTVEGTARMPGFLCRINGRPGVDRDRCVVPSPPNAYWSYWVADRGRAWCFSNAGMNRRPVRGTVEGWSFVAGSGASAPRSSTFSALPGAGTTGRNCDTSAPTTSVPAPTTRPPAAQAPVPAPGANRARQPGPSTAPPQVPAGSSPGAPPGPGEPAGPGAAAGGAAPEVGGEAGAPSPSGVSGATTTSTSPLEGSGSADGAEGAGAGGDTDSASGAASGAVAAGSDDRGDSGDGSEEALSTVELTESGRNGAGSPLGTGLAVGTMATLGVAAVLVNRRRFRSVPGPDAPIGPEPPAV